MESNKLHSSSHIKTLHSTKIFLEQNFLPTSQICHFFFLIFFFRNKWATSRICIYIHLGSKVHSTSSKTWPHIEFSSHKVANITRKDAPIIVTPMEIMVWVPSTNHSTLWSFQPKKKKKKKTLLILIFIRLLSCLLSEITEKDTLLQC